MFSEVLVGRWSGQPLPSFLNSRALQDKFRPDGARCGGAGQAELGTMLRVRSSHESTFSE